ISKITPRILVQEMMPAVAEVLLSFQRDPEAGPVVMLAAGGVLAELHQDKALRLAPVTKEEALGLIGELRLSPILAGYRGRPAGDVEALVNAIVAISHAG